MSSTDHQLPSSLPHQDVIDALVRGAVRGGSHLPGWIQQVTFRNLRFGLLEAAAEAVGGATRAAAAVRAVG